MSDSFRHKPLDRADKEIRLFFLEECHDPISCDPSSSVLPNTTEQKRYIAGRLQHICLDDHPEYVALSYTWGTLENPGQIVVDGASLEVTANLFAVLEVLAGLKELRGRPLWIDGICIDQKNNDEKNLQVPLMGSIYNKASEVFAWIGHDTDGSADVFDALAEYGDYWLGLCEQFGDDRQGLAKAWILDFINDDHHVLQRVSHPMLHRPASQTLEVLERPWWSRVWVIQEVTLAQNASVMCGTRLFPWKNIMGAINFLRFFQASSLVTGPWSGTEALYSPLEHFFVLWGKCGRGQPSTQAEFQERSEDSRRPSEVLRVPELSLEEVLEYVVFLEKETLQASNEKDRVYAFLAFLSQEDRALLEVDYSENTKFSDIMETITRIMFQRHGPRILSLRQPYSIESQGLPSWYIDWTRTQTDLALYDPICAADFAAAGNSWRCRHTYQTRGNSTLLQLEGAKISSVRAPAQFDIDVTPSKNPRSKQHGNEEEVRMLSSWINMMEDLLESFPGDAPVQKACKSSSIATLCLVSTAGNQRHRWSKRDHSLYKVHGSEETQLKKMHRPFQYHDGLIEIPDLPPMVFDEEVDDSELARHGSLHERFEVLMGGRVPEGVEEDFSSLWSQYRSLRSGNPDAEELENPDTAELFIWEYWRRLRLNGHRGFVTSDGRAGLGPRTIKLDDLVVIFEGCEFPFVIRPRYEEKSEYELVGACYVDGIMMGEAMEANPLFEQMFLV